MYEDIKKDGRGIYSPNGFIPSDRVKNGFVFGEDNGDYLYFDPEEDYSIWVYHHDGGDVERISHNFKYFLKKIK